MRNKLSQEDDVEDAFRKNSRKRKLVRMDKQGGEKYRKLTKVQDTSSKSVKRATYDWWSIEIAFHAIAKLDQEKRIILLPGWHSSDRTSRLTKSESVSPRLESDNKEIRKLLSASCVVERLNPNMELSIGPQLNLLLHRDNLDSSEKSGWLRSTRGTSARTRQVFCNQDIVVSNEVMAGKEKFENEFRSNQSSPERTFLSLVNSIEGTSLRSIGSFYTDSMPPEISRTPHTTQSRQSAIQSLNKTEKHTLDDRKGKLATLKKIMKNEKMAEIVSEARVLLNRNDIQNYSSNLKKMCPKEAKIVLDSFAVQNYLQKSLKGKLKISE